MTRNQLEIASIASDLKRVALGLEQNSLAVAECFLREVMGRKDEIDVRELPEYIVGIIKKLATLNIKENKDRLAEDCLMYSTLLQNFSCRF